MDIGQLRGRLASAGQEHLLQFWPELGGAQQAELCAQLQAMDLEELTAFFRRATAGCSRPQADSVDARMEPVPREVLGSATRDRDQLQAWENEGTTAPRVSVLSRACHGSSPAGPGPLRSSLSCTA